MQSRHLPRPLRHGPVRLRSPPARPTRRRPTRPARDRSRRGPGPCGPSGPPRRTGAGPRRNRSADGRIHRCASMCVGFGRWSSRKGRPAAVHRPVRTQPVASATRSSAVVPRRAQGNAAVPPPAVLDADGQAFVHVVRGGLGQQATAGSDQFSQPGEQGRRVAADTDVAVHQQGGAPAAFPRQAVEDGPPHGGAPVAPGPGDGGRADVRTQRRRHRGRPGRPPDVPARSRRPGRDRCSGSARWCRRRRGAHQRSTSSGSTSSRRPSG